MALASSKLEIGTSALGDSHSTWQIRDRVITFSERALVLGIVNVTPDSFSDGGRFYDTEGAVAHALSLIDQGADILDIGGESTRPGAGPVALDEELKRVIPVIERLGQKTKVPISIDTSKAAVARASLEAGAQIVNDVSALGGDPEMIEVAATFGAGVILMHMQGTPVTMQLDPRYGDVVGDIIQYFREKLSGLADRGLPREKLVLDPGIGFGKRHLHNVEILRRLVELQQLRRPVCLGVSRKGTIGKILDRPVEERLAGGLAVTCHAVITGAAQLIRVHDVAQTRDAVLMCAELKSRS